MMPFTLIIVGLFLISLGINTPVYAAFGIGSIALAGFIASR